MFVEREIKLRPSDMGVNTCHYHKRYDSALTARFTKHGITYFYRNAVFRSNQTDLDCGNNMQTAEFEFT